MCIRDRTSFMRRPEYGAKQMTEDGQPAEVGKRRGPVGMVLNTFEWAARFVVHYPQYLFICAVANRIAAGRGKRLGTHTDEVPKCMVDVAGKPILGWVWDALSSVGVDELIVIRGYRGDVLTEFVQRLVPRAISVDNREWETNNILLSLACARAHLDRPAYMMYSDI